MSLDLDHARSYIHGIVCGKTLPSMTEFLSICDYLEITPKNFFDEGTDNGLLLTRLDQYSRDLKESDLSLIVTMAERLRDKK